MISEEGKAGFVEDIGAAFCLYSERSDVQAMQYECDPDGFEAVTITFFSGGSKTINVTGDSCAAILKDIARALT